MQNLSYKVIKDYFILKIKIMKKKLGFSIVIISIFWILLAKTYASSWAQILIDEENEIIYVTGVINTWTNNTWTNNTWTNNSWTINTGIINSWTVNTWTNYTDIITENKEIEIETWIIITTWAKITTWEIIDPEEEFSLALERMYENWLTMYSWKTEYRPQDFLTREESAKILGQAYIKLNFENIEKNTECEFIDAELFNPTLKEHIANTCKRNILKWYSGTFSPVETLTKAQAMAVLIRMFEWKTSYEKQNPRWEIYYKKGFTIGLTNVNDINKFDKNVTRYEIALMVYRFKNIVENEAMQSLSQNAIEKINTEVENENSTWSSVQILSGLTDINSDPEFIEAIHWMYDNWLTIHNNTTDYEPFYAITRVNAAKMIDKFANVINYQNTGVYLANDCNFADIDWLSTGDKEYIANVCQKWLIKWTYGNFRPNEEMTKAQFVVAIVRMFEWQELDETTNPRRQNYFETAKNLWIVAPWDAVTFDSSISRYEVALYFYRFYNKYLMLESLQNNDEPTDQIISTVKWTTVEIAWKQVANIYVNNSLINDEDFDIWYIELLWNRYKLVKTDKSDYFSNNFVRYGDLFDIVTDNKTGTINFIVSNSNTIKGTIRMNEKTYSINKMENTNAYYEIKEN